MYDLTQDYPEILGALSTGFEKFHESFDQHGLDCNVHEISAASYDGFIAHTNGGLRVMALDILNFAESEMGCDNFAADILQPYIDRSRTDAAEEYIRLSENEALCEAWENDLTQSADEFLYSWWNAFETEYVEFHKRQMSVFKVPEWHLSELGMKIEAEREEYWEMEREWMSEGSEFWYEARAIFYDTDNCRNVSGKPEVFLFCGLNTDFTYGRERGLDTSFERNIPLARLTPKRIEVIIDAMIDSITATPKMVLCPQCNGDPVYIDTCQTCAGAGEISKAYATQIAQLAKAA